MHSSWILPQQQARFSSVMTLAIHIWEN
jgi:hypothetical protein